MNIRKILFLFSYAWIFSLVFSFIVLPMPMLFGSNAEAIAKFTVSNFNLGAITFLQRLYSAFVMLCLFFGLLFWFYGLPLYFAGKIVDFFKVELRLKHFFGVE